MRALKEILKPDCFSIIIRGTGINYNIMKSIIKDLFFDKELVENIKKTKADKNILYQQLISGKITLHEYLAAQAGNISN